MTPETSVNLSYDNAFAALTRSGQLKALRVLPLILLLAACSSGNIPLSPYRIDVQQGNALEQESVDKLKPGLTRSQVRFLLGTPLLVDPFHKNRWDYVFNYRKAGKLTEERRLALFFDGDVLVRIEAEGFEPKGELPPANAAAKPVTAPAAQSENPKPAAVEAPKSEPVAKAQPKTEAVSAKPAPTNVASTGSNGLGETSIVSQLKADPEGAQRKTAQASGKPQETLALQAESNIDAIKPEVMPEFAVAKSASMAATKEDQVMAALKAWARAWQARDEKVYLAAYADSFRPNDGKSRAEWEKRRRLLLGSARNIEVKIDAPVFESTGEDKAQVRFRQFYRSDASRDAVIKLLKFVRVNNLWLIEEEKVLAPIKVKK